VQQLSASQAQTCRHQFQDQSKRRCVERNSAMASKFPKNAGDFGKFEFTEHAFGADETRDSPPSPNVDGGITLHPAAAFCWTRWRVNVIPGGGIDCIQHL